MLYILRSVLSCILQLNDAELQFRRYWFHGPIAIFGCTLPVHRGVLTSYPDNPILLLH